MKYSLNWLKEHIDGVLPQQNEIVREVTLRAFEVEEVEEKDGDIIFEMKVLPDRAHDALAHRGMAREIAALLRLPRKQIEYPDVVGNNNIPPVRVIIENPELCARYIARRFNNVTVGKSPQQFVSKLEAIGARSINNIVDITNVVLFDINQPLHAFDADKVVGGITVRLAKSGEKMTTLDNREMVLDGSELVIADDEGVLALAGIKGGKKAEVDSATKNIILECANFNPTKTRKSSQKLNIKTDASKRYENGITSALAGEACVVASQLLMEFGGNGIQAGAITDVYPSPESMAHVCVTTNDINKLIGLALTDADMSEVLDNAKFSYSKQGEEFVVDVPFERLDLRIKEDMVEEIGRHVGYEKVVASLPKAVTRGLPNKRMFYANKVRNVLLARGFSEVFTYSFATKQGGDIEVLYPVGKDRPFIRRDLAHGIRESLLLNTYNTALIGIDEVNIFEIGNVFTTEGEHMSFALGVSVASKSRAKVAKDEMVNLVNEIGNTIGVPVISNLVFHDIPQLGVLKFPPIVCEINFDELIATLPEPDQYQQLNVNREDIRYRALSAYPFIVRDIAIFIPDTVAENVPEQLIKKEAGDLCVRFSRFDKFQKPGEARVSYAYRMVFQSFERTLTDDEINVIMGRIAALCNAQPDWQVR